MTSSDKTTALARLAALHKHLVSWLNDAAYPLWERNGIDAQNGGFIETLAQKGEGLPHPRRARVHPRQIYAFAQAPGLGWSGDALRIVGRGITYFTTHYRRSDGLFRTLAGTDGAPLDERAVLYDQAFALLGYAATASALDSLHIYEQQAIAPSKRDRGALSSVGRRVLFYGTCRGTFRIESTHALVGGVSCLGGNR